MYEYNQQDKTNNEETNSGAYLVVDYQLDDNIKVSSG